MTPNDVLTDEEIRSIAKAVINGHNGEFVDRDEITRAVRWCEGIRVDAGILALVLSGRLAMRWDARLADWRLWDAEAPR